MVKDEMINYGAQIIAQTLSKTGVIKFNDIGLRKMSQVIEDMNKGVMEALYNAGYRKVGDDEIVESMKTYERARQETARDILQELYSTPHEYHEKKIVDLAKAYGIELED